MRKKPAPVAAESSETTVLQKDFAEKSGITQQAVSDNKKIAKSEDGSVDVRRTTDIHDAVLRKERAIANLRELEYKRLSGDLVEIALVEKYFATSTKLVTDQLLSFPEKVSPMLAALTDVRQIRDLLAQEIRQILTNLPKDIKAIAVKPAA